MSFAKTILVSFCVLGASIGFRVEAQVGKAKPVPPRAPSFSRISQQEIALLLSDVGESNPQILKLLEEDPQMRKAQLDNLRKLLAFASEAVRTGISNEPYNRNELENIRVEVTAVQYDRRLNSEKGAKAPFALITDADVAVYYGDKTGSKLPAAQKTLRKQKFEKFLDTKIHLLGVANPAIRDKTITEEERTQARVMFAKMQIYADEYARRSALLPASFKAKVNLQVKLQQAQFLARAVSESIVSEIAVSDEEIARYLKEHPELDTAAQRTKAEKILERAKSGEDFAKLANEFTEDPGNKNPQGEPQGGLYSNVNKGVMVPPFERAALALEPGHVSPGLVETDFGYHIVKLERKGETYDVRHILIATSVEDPSTPEPSTIPVRQHVKKEIEEEKERQVIDRLVIKNKISVPADILIPGPPKAQPTPAPRKSVRKGS